MENKKWTQDELITLKVFKGSLGYSRVAKKLGRSVNAVRLKACQLGITEKTYWVDAKIKRLAELYPNSSWDTLLDEFGSNKHALIQAANRLGLKRDREISKRIWTDSDNDLLRKMYPTDDLNQVAKRLGRSVEAVRVQASKLKIQRL